jgi:hypothetical protein
MMIAASSGVAVRILVAAPIALSSADIFDQPLWAGPARSEFWVRDLCFQGHTFPRGAKKYAGLSAAEKEARGKKRKPETKRRKKRKKETKKRDTYKWVKEKKNKTRSQAAEIERKKVATRRENGTKTGPKKGWKVSEHTVLSLARMCADRCD